MGSASQAYVIGSPNLRGIGAAGLALRPKLQIIKGRMFRPGLAELIVGSALRDAFVCVSGTRSPYDRNMAHRWRFLGRSQRYGE